MQSNQTANSNETNSAIIQQTKENKTWVIKEITTQDSPAAQTEEQSLNQTFKTSDECILFCNKIGVTRMTFQW